MRRNFVRNRLSFKLNILSLVILDIFRYKMFCVETSTIYDLERVNGQFKFEIHTHRHNSSKFPLGQDAFQVKFSLVLKT